MIVNPNDIIVTVDPGHGGKDPGAVCGNLVEKVLNLIVAKECKKTLEAYGVRANLTREGDTFLELSERGAIANKANANLCVSIHFNAGGGDGVEAIHSVFHGEGEPLAKKVVDAIARLTGQNFRPRPTYSRVNDRGTDYYGMIRYPKMPSIIVECGFIDNAKDAQAFDTLEEQQLFGRAIAFGILDELGINYNTPVPKPEPPVVPVTVPAPSVVDKRTIDIQTKLNKLQVRDDEGKALVVDGKYGSRTKQAVKRFEQIMALTIDEGLWGPQCDAAYASIVAKPLIQYSPNYNQVARYVQFRIGAASDGYFGNISCGKLRAYQSAKGLVVDASCGPKTWASLIGE